MIEREPGPVVESGPVESGADVQPLPGAGRTAVGNEPARVDPPEPPRPSRWRRYGRRLLLLVFCLSAVLSVVAVWARNQIYDEDRYVRTVAPLGAEPAIQAALVARINTRLSGVVDEVLASDAVADRRGVIAVPLAFLVEQYLNDTVEAFVTSDRFPPLWEQIARAEHPVVRVVLTGDETDQVTTADGTISLDIAPLVTEVLNRLRERGINVVDRIQVDQLDTSFVVFQSDDLAKAQGAVRLLNDFAFVLTVLALLSLAGYIAVSSDRRRAVVWAGVGLAGAMTLLLVMLAIGRWRYLDTLDPGVQRDAASAFFDVIGRYMRGAARLLALLGLLLAATAIVTRPGGWLRRDRGMRARATGAWDGATARWPGLDRAGAWSYQHRQGLAAALVVGCCLVAISRDRLTLGWAGAIVLVAVAGVAALLLRPDVGGEAAASPGLTPAFAGDGAAAIRPGEGDAVPARPAAAADELSADDVRVLRRLARALRDSS